MNTNMDAPSMTGITECLGCVGVARTRNLLCYECERRWESDLMRAYLADAVGWERQP